jgi:hypothetical protein
MKTFTVKSTATADEPVLVAGVDLDAARAAHDAAHGHAMIIDESDGLLACMAGVDLACECPRCVPVVPAEAPSSSPSGG